MNTARVSFGNVTAVSGTPSRIKHLNNSLKEDVKNGKVIVRDVTKRYMNLASNGQLANAAQNGDKIQVYITGRDVKKVKSSLPEWDTIEGILSHITSHIEMNRKSVGEVKNSLFTEA